jgi:DNA-binding CsgD family transcriptional regulator
MLASDVAAVREAMRRCLELGAGRAAEHALDVAYLLMYIGDHGEARTVLDSLIDRVRREGSFFDLAQALNAHASIEGRLGHLASAEAAASEALSLTTAAGLLYSECHSLSYLAVIEAMLGKHEECENHAQRALDLSPRVLAGAQQSARALHALGLSALVRGRVAPAIEAFERCRDIMSGAPGIVFWQPDLIDAYIRAGRIDDARKLSVTFEREASSLAHEFALVQAARCRATLADVADADAAFDEATRLCDVARWPFERARCDLANGERLRRGGQRAAARVQLRSAIEIFDRIGAAGFAERARQELSATGERLRARADDEPERLTTQELQIALLVARGATNREAAASVFLSPKTVEKHLSNAYRKLGVRSRSELARRLSD